MLCTGLNDCVKPPDVHKQMTCYCFVHDSTGVCTASHQTCLCDDARHAKLVRPVAVSQRGSLGYAAFPIDNVHANYVVPLVTQRCVNVCMP